MSTLIKIPSESFKRIEVPGESIDGRMYISVVNIKDLPSELDDWREVNPREVNLGSGVSKEITKTLLDNPEKFILRNRGITLIVDHVEFDNRSKFILLELSDKEKNGVLDGGHTLMNIRHYLEDAEDPSDAYVKLEILEGIDDLDEAVRLVDSRNRSTSVKLASLENLLGHFDTLKDVLRMESFADKIAYKENELAESAEGKKKKEIPIEEILSYIICFDVEEFDHKKHPIKAYSGKASVVKHFESNTERMKKYFPLTNDILALRDKIYADLPVVWNSTGNNAEGGKLGRIRGVKVLKDEKILPFSDRRTRHILPASFIYPALAGFRAAVEIRDGVAVWKSSPFELYEGIKEELVAKIVETAKRIGNPNQMGKDPIFWEVCYTTVEREMRPQKT